MVFQTILSPLTPHNSTCGYCSPPGRCSETASSWHAAECIPTQISCEASMIVYQKMIDRGWRRSGTYCYKPDLRRSCCPAYTIKLDALKFSPSKSQRKIISRWNRFVLHGDRSVDAASQNAKNPPFSLSEAIHSTEYSVCTSDNPVHKFEVTLEPSSFTEEKFVLYQKYQQEIHHEKEKAPGGFKRFLVETPLHRDAIIYPGARPDHLPREYGSYHQMYRLDGELIAIGVIDILPNCVSSVYFMYDIKWERFSLGKLSALREASLAKELHTAGVVDLKALYMGFYIHSCKKMRYKGDYYPSYLADPEEYTWYPLETCRPLLDKFHYVSFAHPEHNLKAPATEGCRI
ncbi:hypothetical protein POSPLADRAFT_1150353 [Postia placenta MAD-698-R-SB12]|uniref:arginyltransferase n=1 Tax=Postia placenta MAD-698-R-SB12 TaxID=670580 RepID=A0A1X6MSG9_9APHY|nr:hypothetical protein POSPLADRAFT_1150353 [Postia placenta MAD-698-R-SB12]OSX59239.1 hypothetical protein POSPLADRAFT_1150353 [Postia placenta MAD-698-R-SB12]